MAEMPLRGVQAQEQLQHAKYQAGAQAPLQAAAMAKEHHRQHGAQGDGASIRQLEGLTKPRAVPIAIITPASTRLKVRLETVFMFILPLTLDSPKKGDRPLWRAGKKTAARRRTERRRDISSRGFCHRAAQRALPGNEMLPTPVLSDQVPCPKGQRV